MDVIIITMLLISIFLSSGIIYLILSNSSKIGKNKVHFYVTRDKNGVALWFGKPYRGTVYWGIGAKSYLLAVGEKELNLYGLNYKDYDNLKWEDEPVEVFLNLE